MAAANLNTIRATIEQLLANEFNSLFDSIPSIDAIVSIDDSNDPGLPTVYPVVFNNVPYAPTPNSTWVQCQLNFGNNNYLTMGGTTGVSNSIIGIILVNIFTPKGAGAGANFTIGKRVRDVYNRSTVSGVIFDAASGPEVMSAGVIETGASAGSGLTIAYFQTQIRLTFETFEDL